MSMTKAAMEPNVSTTTMTTTEPMMNNTGTNATAANEAASKLVESIDEFLGDIEKKFRTISDEILTKLDDMAERCDRLEQDMLLSSSSGASVAGAAGQEGGDGSSPTGDADKDAGLGSGEAGR